MKVCVIGAGVVGCAAAFELARAGHEVVLLDAGTQPGTGTSYANGGQLSYSYVEPLAGPATLFSLPRLLFDRDSPVRLRVRPEPRQWAWGMRFLAACTAAQSRSGTRHLLELGRLSRDVLDTWLLEEALDFDFARNGKLVICPDHSSLDRQAMQVALQAEFGARQEILDRAGCIAREPRLADHRGFVGGVWTPSECVGDPHRYCVALVDALKRRGGQVLLGAQVRRFVVREGRCHAAVTSQGEVEADAFVLAAGLSSRVLGEHLGENLPLYPIKGYSLTLRVRAGQALPRTNVTDLGRKMVLAPIGDRLRVAAMAELVGEDTTLPPERIRAIEAAVDTVFPGLCERGDNQAWTGLRPATPTSVPIVRRSRVRNVLLNVGHGALGFTLAAGCAARVARLIEPAAEPA
jgi:D-amino-acid dehydrogenase